MYLFVCDFFEIYPCGHIYQWLLLLFSQSCPTLCNPMDCSMVGFPDFHYLPEFAQTHVHWITMTIFSSLLLYIYYWLYVVVLQSVMFNSLRPHGLQHTRLPWALPSPGACSNSCPLVGDAIQPSCLLSSPSPPAFDFPSIRVFSPVSQLFTSGGQSTGASSSVLQMNIQGWFPLGLTGLIL